jgi:hypothetical protein
MRYPTRTEWRQETEMRLIETAGKSPILAGPETAAKKNAARNIKDGGLAYTE